MLKEVRQQRIAQLDILVSQVTARNALIELGQTNKALDGAIILTRARVRKLNKKVLDSMQAAY